MDAMFETAAQTAMAEWLDDDELLAECAEDLTAFLRGNAADIALSGLTGHQVGEDFWLTRNRHGAGFWDRGLGEVGLRLTEAARVYGTVDVPLSDDWSDA
jgi:hypothetical protein